LLVCQAQELREIKKNIRLIDKRLAEIGYSEKDISPRLILNIEFARANIKNLIYDQAVLEGIETTFPQTETILDNGKVSGVAPSDVLKILNLKRAWEFILDENVISSDTNFHMLAYIAKIVNEGFYENGGKVRTVPVAIGGSTYLPPIPHEATIKECLREILASSLTPIDTAVKLCLYVMKTQVFIDGNKRAVIIFANQYLISKGQGLIVVPESSVNVFKRLLIDYYEGENEAIVSNYLIEKCWRKF